MPGINVIDRDDDRQNFPEASTWHIDDRGQLHINGDDGPIASYAKDCWLKVGSDVNEANGSRNQSSGNTHVQIKRNKGGTHGLIVDGVDLSMKVLVDGFGVEFGHLHEPDRVSFTVAADTLDIDLPDPVIQALRQDGGPTDA